MGLDASINPPLVNELKAIGLLDGTADTSLVSVPSRLAIEAFDGKASGTQTLSNAPTNVIAVLSVPIANGTDFAVTLKVVTTNYTLSSTTLTYVTDESLNHWIIFYNY